MSGENKYHEKSNEGQRYLRDGVGCMHHWMESNVPVRKLAGTETENMVISISCRIRSVP